MTILPFPRQVQNADCERGHPTTRRALQALRAKLHARAVERIHRQSYRQMMELDDAILRDIGVTRGEITWAASLPLGVDSKAAIAENRARSERAA